MKKSTLFLILIIILSKAGLAQTLFLSSGIPENGLPLAQIFDNKIADKSLYQQSKNKVYYIWGSRTAQQPEGVSGSKYFPSIRNPDRKLDLKWYQENHPDWVMYQEDKKTPAYGYVYSYGGLVPLDVSNPEVRDFYLQKFIMPAVNAGYKMVAMDNVDLGNWPKAVGRFKGTEWITLYTGKKNDAVFQENMIAWMQFLKQKLNPLGVAVVANIKATTAPENVIIKTIDAVDAWLDENGFAHKGIKVTDKKWEEAIAIINKVTQQKGYISINQMRGEKAEDWPEDQVSYVIGSYLLSRGPKSLLAMCSYTDNAIYHHYFYRKEMDTDIGKAIAAAVKESNGLWTRKFSKGLVIVNPSSKSSQTITLPKGKWKTLSGEIIEGYLLMPAASASILTTQ